MKLFIVIDRKGWWHAYSSRWAWAFRREPILRARSRKAMEAAVENLRQLKERVAATA